ncbi:hypothetical protein TWF173_005444 [Orbilia oligospora]|uniref:Uncharacterized protein n=2 Tax=Orbilia oligospora TaxID=2813651 RepID=G1X357_ARTOA|nr:hypothetical protein AOL_s00043g130 [Orbilia oligospora ATCC 24927]EGX52341.1 hypothetical protein AOL_s00043g130 [Orbilia oligospora ATCC 24927]KAF3273676.1 hypothetical protein TWF970_008875 [Orbilia oligospora]KAF3319039.1 hypothetical protein TWF173_005444 [Orbilia oligospora]
MSSASSSPPVPTSAIVNCVVNMVLLGLNAYKMLFDPLGALSDPLYPYFVKIFRLPNFAIQTQINEFGVEEPVLDPFTMQLTTVIAILCAHSAVLYAVMLIHRQWEYIYMTALSKAVGVVGVGIMAWTLFPERASPPIALFVVWDTMCVLHLWYVLGTAKGSSKGMVKGKTA